MFAQSTSSRVRAIAAARPAGIRSHRGSVKCAADGRLVGLPAPDFEAEAVYDQEFMEVKLSDYACVSSQPQRYNRRPDLSQFINCWLGLCLIAYMPWRPAVEGGAVLERRQTLTQAEPRDLTSD